MPWRHVVAGKKPGESRVQRVSWSRHGVALAVKTRVHLAWRLVGSSRTFSSQPHFTCPRIRLCVCQPQLFPASETRRNDLKIGELEALLQGSSFFGQLSQTVAGAGKEGLQASLLSPAREH